MSKVSVKTPQISKTETLKSGTSLKNDEELDTATQPEFIYGGPFTKSPKPVFANIVTPRNVQLQGSFKRSFAYHSLKERFPVILTKIIDYLSREKAKVKSANKASDEDVRKLIQYVVQLKNEIATNKSYALLTTDTPESRKWNDWIKNADSPYYFTNNWVFSECYVYRRLREGCELTKGLFNFDPFEEQKIESFTGSLELMCVLAEKVNEMLQESEKEKRKADFISLLKVCLWSNKCDLSLSMGEQVSLVNEGNIGTSPSRTVIDPLQMIVDLKDKVLVDDSAKIYDQVIAKAETLAKNIEANPSVKAKCSCSRLAPPGLAPGTVSKAPKGEAPPPAKEGEGPPQPPCPAKMTAPATVTFDIVCDNAGYELFTDLCLADFLISQKIVKKVRFHVKEIPWFVSDVTPKDFKYVISRCADSSFNKVVQPPPQPERATPEGAPTEGAPPEGAPPEVAPPEGAPPEVAPPEVAPPEGATPEGATPEGAPPEEATPEGAPPEEATPEGAEGQAPSQTTISADALRSLGERWRTYLDNGTYELLCDSFWTSPHVYKDMKKYDPQLYRNLQFAVAILFKGDLNYRKLLGERNCNPTSRFESALQGFMPAPIIALRTVKADLICGLPKGKAEQLNKIDERWMEKGNYGVIQFCAKREALKLSDRPCAMYGTTCRGEGCAATAPS